MNLSFRKDLNYSIEEKINFKDYDLKKNFILLNSNKNALIEKNSEKNDKFLQEKKLQIKKKINYGICILKIFFSFCVITIHFWNPSKKKIRNNIFFKDIRTFSNSMFMIISFFLTYKNYSKNGKFVKRFLRIIIPFEVWAVLYYLIYRLISKIYKTKFNIKTEDILWQLSLGSSEKLCYQFWFIWELLIISLIFFIIGKFLEQYMMKIIFILFLVSITLQYNGINYFYFKNYPFFKLVSLGRLVEMIPCAFLGLLFGKQNLINYLDKNKIFNFFTLSFILYDLFNFYFFIEPSGLFNQGLLRLAKSSCLFLLINLIPFNILHKKILFVIELLSKYNFGVYCLHLVVGNYLNFISRMHNFVISPLNKCLLIKVISLILSKLISLIPNKYGCYLVC